MLSTNRPTSLVYPPLVKRCSSFWRILLVYDFRMYTFVSPVAQRSTFRPFSSRWRRSLFRFTKKEGRWQISRDTSNRSCTLIGICEDGQRRISSWSSTHSRIEQTACKPLPSWSQKNHSINAAGSDGFTASWRSCVDASPQVFEVL